MLKDHLAYRMEKNKKQAGRGWRKTYGYTGGGKIRSDAGGKIPYFYNLMQGKENPVICEELTISTNTLKKHILNIYRKLGIRNRVQLFKMIREHEETV